MWRLGEQIGLENGLNRTHLLILTFSSGKEGISLPKGSINPNLQDENIETSVVSGGRQVFFSQILERLQSV